MWLAESSIRGHASRTHRMHHRAWLCAAVMGTVCRDMRFAVVAGQWTSMRRYSSSSRAYISCVRAQRLGLCVPEHEGHPSPGWMQVCVCLFAERRAAVRLTRLSHASQVIMMGVVCRGMGCVCVARAQSVRCAGRVRFCHLVWAGGRRSAGVRVWLRVSSSVRSAAHVAVLW